MKPVSFKILGPPWIRLMVWAICPPDADMSSLIELANSRLGFYELQATADELSGKWNATPRAVMHCLVHCWAWPILWLLLLGDKFFGPPIVSLTTVKRANGTHTYRVGQPDPERSGILVTGIRRDQHGYHIESVAGYLGVAFGDVDHTSILRGATSS